MKLNQSLTNVERDEKQGWALQQFFCYWEQRTQRSIVKYHGGEQASRTMYTPWLKGRDEEKRFWMVCRYIWSKIAHWIVDRHEIDHELFIQQNWAKYNIWSVNIHVTLTELNGWQPMAAHGFTSISSESCNYLLRHIAQPSSLRSCHQYAFRWSDISIEMDNG